MLSNPSERVRARWMVRVEKIGVRGGKGETGRGEEEERDGLGIDKRAVDIATLVDGGIILIRDGIEVAFDRF